MEQMESAATNVQVAVRCRPINEDEERRGFVPIVAVDTERRHVKISYGAGMKKTTKSFAYDRVFGRFATQEDVFKATVAPMVDEVLGGFSCTAFAYGQTGTGKTHTMEGNLGNAKDYGIIPRAVASVFEKLEATGADYTVRISFLEIYQEQLEDLLEPSNASASAKAAGSGSGKGGGLRLVEDAKKGVQVLGLEEVGCADLPSAVALLQRGVKNRMTAATLCNKNSSRSHSVFTLKVVVKELNAASGEEEVRAGQLNLVDLAGSECVGRSGAKDQRAREAGNINQSLLTLGRVITALTEGHSHIPYRDSKLTRLLQESLGGRAKTWIIATLSPIASNVDETLSTLEYALKAKSITNKPLVNAKSSSKTIMREYAGEIESLRSMLMATREKNGVYMAPAEYDQLQAKLAAQTDRIAECEAALRQRETELEEAKGAVGAVQGKLDATTEALHKTEGELAQSRETATRLQGELTEARCDLAGARAVIAEQARTERELQAQAGVLAASLEAAREDVHGLMAKVERCSAALEARSKAAAALLTECQALLSQGQTAITGLGSAGQDAASALESAIAALVEKEVTETAAALQSLSREVDGLVVEGGDAAARAVKAMCARLSQEVVAVLVEQSKQHVLALVALSNAYEMAVMAGEQELERVFAGTVAEVDATVNEVTKAAKYAKQMVRGLPKANAARATAVEGELAAFQTSWAEKEQAAEKARAAFVEEQQAALSTGTQAILASVQQQVAALMQSCESRGIAFNQAAAAAVEEKEKKVAQLLDAVAIQTKSANAEVATFCESAGQHIDMACIIAEKGVVDVKTTHVHAHAVAVGRVREEAVSLVRGLEGMSAAADREMQATLSVGEEVIASIEAETGKVEALLKEKGAGVSAAMAQAGQTSAARLTEQRQALTALLQTQLREPLAAGVTAASASLASTGGVVATYGAAASRVEPAGKKATPTKRDYPTPGSLSATRPHVEIVAEARARAALQFGEGSGELVASSAAAPRQQEEQQGPEKRAAPVAEQGEACAAGAEEEEGLAVASPNKKPRLSGEPAPDAAAVATVAAASGEEEAAVPMSMQVEQEQPEAEQPSAAAEGTSTNKAAAVAGSGIPAPKTSRIPRPGKAKPLIDVKNVR